MIPRLIAAVPDLLGLVARLWEVTKGVVLLSLLPLIHVSGPDVGVTAETRLAISGAVCLANQYKASASRIEVLRYLEKATMCSYSPRLAL